MSHVYFWGLLSILRTYKEKTAFLRFWCIINAFLGMDGILYQHGINIRLKRLFHASDSATLFFINLCARFCFEASPSFLHSIFSILICVFFFVFKHYFIILFFYLLSLCFSYLLSFSWLSIYLII